MAPFSQSSGSGGWWGSRTGLEQKLIILGSILFLLSFCLMISTIVLSEQKAVAYCECGENKKCIIDHHSEVLCVEGFGKIVISSAQTQCIACEGENEELKYNGNGDYICACKENFGRKDGQCQARAATTTIAPEDTNSTVSTELPTESISSSTSEPITPVTNATELPTPVTEKTESPPPVTQETESTVPESNTTESPAEVL